MAITVCDISGMGGREVGGYEWGCQVLCLRALHFLASQKPESELPRFMEFKNIIGLAIADNPAAKEMDKYVMDHPVLKEKGITGAMHQHALAHARKLFEVGRDSYLAELRAAGREPDDF